MDSLDHIQNQILWIHDPKRFFTTDPKQNPVTRNNFNTHSSRLITLLTFSAIFEVEAWIKRSMVKSQYKQDVPCSSSQGQIETKLQHNFTGASCSILLFQQLSYFKTRLHSAHLKQYPWANQKNQQICSIISSRVILFSRYCRYCRSFLWKWIKNHPLLDTSFLFSTKNPNNPDFWSDFSKKRTQNLEAMLSRDLATIAVITLYRPFMTLNESVSWIGKSEGVVEVRKWWLCGSCCMGVATDPAF